MLLLSLIRGLQHNEESADFGVCKKILTSAHVYCLDEWLGGGQK
jgi:hypothetical protein